MQHLNFHNYFKYRYGSPPLPRLVPVQEMDELLPLVEKSKATVPANGNNKTKSVADVIRVWYRKDENACPAVYTLQPITVHFKDFVTTKGIAHLSISVWSSFLSPLDCFSINGKRSCHALADTSAGP